MNNIQLTVPTVVDFLSVRCQLPECVNDILFMRAGAKFCCENHRKLAYKRLKQTPPRLGPWGPVTNGLVVDKPDGYTGDLTRVRHKVCLSARVAAKSKVGDFTGKFDKRDYYRDAECRIKRTTL